MRLHRFIFGPFIVSSDDEEARHAFKSFTSHVGRLFKTIKQRCHMTVAVVFHGISVSSHIYFYNTEVLHSQRWMELQPHSLSSLPRPPG